MATGTYFFATREDLLGALGPASDTLALSYVLAGMSPTSAPAVFLALEALPGLGVAPVGDATQAPRYLAFPQGRPLNLREIPQRRGGVLFAVDQLLNPDTVVLAPGGVFAGGRAIISGELASLAATSQSGDLLRTLSGALRHRFTRVQSFYVGAEAAQLWRSGYRLTRSVRSPAGFDLHANAAEPSVAADAGPE